MQNIQILAPKNKVIVAVDLPKTPRESLAFELDKVRVATVESSGVEGTQKFDQIIFGDDFSILPLAESAVEAKAYFAMKEDNIYCILRG